MPILAIAGLSAVTPRTLPSQEDLDAKARAIHQRVLAIDSHVDVLLPSTPPQYFAEGRTSRDLDKLRRGGIGAVAVSAFNAYLKPLPRDFAERLKAVRLQFGLAEATEKGTGAIEEGVTALPADTSQANLAQARVLIPRAIVADYVDHIDYLVTRIGVDHVGIGTDFNHAAGIDGFDDESQAPNVTRELVRRDIL
jgi:membrane dipeptidase